MPVYAISKALNVSVCTFAIDIVEELDLVGVR